MSKRQLPTPTPTKDAARRKLEEEADALIREAAIAERNASISAKAARRDALENGTPEALPTRPSVHKDLETSQVKSPRNRAFNLKGVIEVLVDAGVNPAEEILRVLPDLEPDVQARFYAELLNYVQPKLKAVEVTGRNGGPIEVASLTDEQRRERLAELQAKMHAPVAR